MPSVVHDNGAVWCCRNTEFWRDSGTHGVWTTAPRWVLGQALLEEEEQLPRWTTQPLLQTIRLQELKINCRWVSGQFSESNSKGKRHCGLIKAIFSQRTKCIDSVNSHILQPSTVQSFRNLTKESCGFVEVSHRADQRLAAWFKGIREYSSSTGNTYMREATMGSQRVPQGSASCPRLPPTQASHWATSRRLGQQSPRSPRPQRQVRRRSLHQNLQLRVRGPLSWALTHPGYRKKSPRTEQMVNRVDFIWLLTHTHTHTRNLWQNFFFFFQKQQLTIPNILSRKEILSVVFRDVNSLLFTDVITHWVF